MLASVIRELAASKNSELIAAAFFEKTIQVWDLQSQKEICEFPALFCAGARNLALAPDGGKLVAGISKVRGEMAAYEIPNGKKLWERRLTYPSSLQFDPTGQFVTCTSNRNSVFRLEMSTGATVQEKEGISRYIEGPDGDALSVSSKKEDHLLRLIAGGNSFDISHLGFALLDAKFSPHHVCLTEAAGPVRCISRDDGTLQWTFDPGNDSHVLRLHYSPRLNAFFGVLRHLKSKGVNYLMRFDVSSGATERVCDLDSWEEVFVDAADQLVTSSGEIRELTNGELLGQLAFPVKEYPDE